MAEPSHAEPIYADARYQDVPYEKKKQLFDEVKEDMRWG